VTQPNVTPDVPVLADADWAYTAKLEVRPEVKDIVLDGIELKRTVYTIADSDVDHQIEHLRDQHSNLKAPEPARAVKKSDLVTLDYDVTIDGAAREDMNMRNRTVEVGNGRLLNELDAGIPGMNVGETKDIEVKFDEKHAREELRNKVAILKVTVSEIREKVLPDVDDEFAKDAGHESLAALKTKIRTDLEKESKEASESQLREDAVLALVEKNPVAVPPSLLNNAVSILAREIAQQDRMRGQTIDAEKIIVEAKTQAETRVRAGLILGEMAKQNSLTVTEDDLNARIDEMAKETGKAAAKLRAEHREPKKREALANAALEDKVMALLLSRVKVTDVPADKPLHDHDHA
ncbi:MAG: trigger factor, partial [Deltaproteobacteria bacterium]